MELKVKRLEKQGFNTVPLPEKQTAGAAGYDLAASLENDVTLSPGSLVKIPCGIAVEIGRGFAGLVFGRSGMGIKHGIHPSNGVGVIDSDYRGEVCVGLCNVSRDDYVIRPGDRIAQLVIIPVADVTVAECDELSNTERGEKGFGSTGRV